MSSPRAASARHTSSSSRIIAKHRSRFKTIPIWPALIDEDEARAAMRAARDREDPSAALYWAQILLRCRKGGDPEAREIELECLVQLEELYLGWVGGWMRVPVALCDEAPFEMDPEEELVIAAIDGRCTVRGLVDVSPLSPLDVLKLIQRLVHAGAIALD